MALFAIASLRFEAVVAIKGKHLICIAWAQRNRTKAAIGMITV